MVTWQRCGFLICVHSLNSLKGVYIGDYYRGYEGGYQEFRQFLICVHTLMAASFCRLILTFLRDDRGRFGVKMWRSKAVKKHWEQRVPKGSLLTGLLVEISFWALRCKVVLPYAWRHNGSRLLMAD